MGPQINNMEELLAQLLVPDNDSISQATKALQDSFKSAEAIPMLCNVLSSSTSTQIRQYAAVILRKRLSKPKNWSKLPPEVQALVKNGIIPVLINEKEKAVKTSVVQFIGAIAKHEMPNGTWPDLSKLLQTLITSQTQSDVELGMFTMSVLTDIALDVFASNPAQFVYLFNTAFNSLDNLNTVLGYYTVVTMTRVISVCESDNELKNIYSKAIPKILTALPALATADEEKALDVMDFFYEILSDVVALMTPHMSPFIQLCLHLAGSTNLGDSIRDRALTLISMAVRVKKKLLVKLLLVKPIVEVVFRVMCEPPEGGADPEEDDWFTEEDDEAPYQSATNTLGVLAIYLPPKQLLESLLQLVSSNLQTGDLSVKKGCYLAMAAVTEGASECIRANYLSMFLQCVCAGITDNAPSVRNAALYALGQLSEHLQPEISEHHAELMPILFEYLSQLCQRVAKGSADPPGLYSMFYALESFCENLEGKIMPYLPTLLDRLIMLLDRKHSVNVQELTLSAVGSVASAVNADILPFFPTILDKLKIYLLEMPTEETSCLQVQALQTLSLLGRTMGADNFMPMAKETVELGLKLLASTEDPELKGATFCLFSSLATVLKTDSAIFLPTVVEAAIVSLKSTEGVVPHLKEEAGPFTAFEDLSDEADEEDIEKSSDTSEEPEELLVENPYMEEKEEACAALKDFAMHAGSAFLPYLEKCFEEVYELTSYPYDDVRKSALEALAQFCVNFSKIESAEGKQALQKSLELLVPQCTDTAAKDGECTVVNSALEALATLLKEIGPPALAPPGSKEAILKVVNDVLLSKAECQDKEEFEDEEEDEEAEQDELIMESAGEVIPALGKAVSPSEFVLCLQALLPAILPKLSKQSSTSQKSFFIGTLADCMEAAGPELQQRQDLSQQLLSLYLPLAQDSNQEVRNNAIFGLGELVLHSKKSLFSHYNDILQTLSTALSKESYGLAVDNICGALARLIITNHELVPIEDAFPVLLNKLPLKDDLDEHNAVMKCFGHLYQLGHPSLKAHITTVIRVLCVVLLEKRGKDEVVSMALELLKMCHKDFTTEVNSVLQGFPADASAQLSNILSS